MARLRDAAMRMVYGIAGELSFPADLFRFTTRRLTRPKRSER